MVPVYLQEGGCRLSADLEVVEGRWYLGFTCPHCSAQIFALEDPSEGQNKTPMIGPGTLVVPCRSCKRDGLQFTTGQLGPIKATKNRPSSKGRRIKPSRSARQPVSRKFSKVFTTFDINSLEGRPQSSAIIARCISGWSYVETALSLLLGTILKINYAPAAAMFLAIQNSRTQQQVLMAVAESILNEKDLEMIGALMNIVARLEKERNDLAHGLFAESMLIDPGVIWTTQLDYVNNRVAFETKNPEFSEKISKRIFVYEAEDLEKIAQDFECKILSGCIILSPQFQAILVLPI